jgi:ribosomal protein S5
MAKIINKVKTSDLELKDRLVAINRVTKVTKGDVHSVSQQLLLLVTKTVLLAGDLEKQAK